MFKNKLANKMEFKKKIDQNFQGFLVEETHSV